MRGLAIDGAAFGGQKRLVLDIPRFVREWRLGVRGARGRLCGFSFFSGRPPVLGEGGTGKEKCATLSATRARYGSAVKRCTEKEEHVVWPLGGRNPRPRGLRWADLS